MDKACGATKSYLENLPPDTIPTKQPGLYDKWMDVAYAIMPHDNIAAQQLLLKAEYWRNPYNFYEDPQFDAIPTINEVEKHIKTFLKLHYKVDRV